MNGCVFKRKLPSGTITWAYSLDHGRQADGKRLRDFKSGYPTMRAAKDALDEAIKEHDAVAGRVTEEIGLRGERVWAFSFRDVRETGFESRADAQRALIAARETLAEKGQRPAKTAKEAAITLAEFFMEIG